MGTGSQVSGGDDVLCGIGKEADGVGDDEDRHGVVQWEKGVDVIAKEHDADDKEEAAFDGGEGIILRLTEKFGVVREGEMTRRESELTQLDERGVSIIRLLLPPTSESLLWALMAFCTIQRRRQMVTSIEASGIVSRAGGSLWQPFSHFCREAFLLIVSEKSLMTGFP